MDRFSSSQSPFDLTQPEVTTVVCRIGGIKTLIEVIPLIIRPRTR